MIVCRELAVLALIVMWSCSGAGPRSLYPSGSSPKGAASQLDPAAQQGIAGVFRGSDAVTGIQYGVGTITIAFPDGRLLRVEAVERWTDPSGATTMVCGEATASLQDLDALSPHRVSPPPDVLKAMHVDGSRADQVVFYQYLGRQQGALYLLFLGPDRGAAARGPVAVFLRLAVQP